MSAAETAFIRAIRRKRGLNQKDAGELFGGGVNAFSRYALGKIRPPRALVVLFTLLDRHPGLMEDILPRG